MRLLERSLEKITSLLRVGFGEAGAGIIRANLNMQGGEGEIERETEKRIERLRD